MIQFCWNNEIVKGNETFITINHFNELYLLIKQFFSNRNIEIRKEDIEIRYHGLDKESLERIYAVNIKNFSALLENYEIMGWTNGTFESPKDMRELEKFEFNDIEIKKYENGNRHIKFKINNHPKVYSMEMMLVGKNWVLCFPYIWDLYDTNECPFCNEVHNHCSDYLNYYVDGIFERLMEHPRTRMELLF
jgi:hypothetical protein